MILTKEQSLGGKGRVYKVVKFEELDGELRLGSLTAGAALDLTELKARIAKGEPGAEKRLMVLMLLDAVVDERGAPLFDEASCAEFLRKISPETLLRISQETPQSAATREESVLKKPVASQGA